MVEMKKVVKLLKMKMSKEVRVKKEVKQNLSLQEELLHSLIK